MKKLKTFVFYAAIIAFTGLMNACTQKSEKSEEVDRMDSVSTSLKKSSDELEKKTKDLEEALADLDKDLEKK